jgi:hypothetical protein
VPFDPLFELNEDTIFGNDLQQESAIRNEDSMNQSETPSENVHENIENAATNGVNVIPTTNPPVCSPRGFNWYQDDRAIMSEINRTYNAREWGLKTPIGDVLCTECKNKMMSRFDIFYHMFPPSQLDVMVRCTNTILHEMNKKTTTKGEMLKS